MIVLIRPFEAALGLADGKRIFLRPPESREFCIYVIQRTDDPRAEVVKGARLVSFIIDFLGGILVISSQVPRQMIMRGLVGRLP